MNQESSNQVAEPQNDVDPVVAGQQILNQMIGDCKKCYNRRVIGYNVTYNKPVFCSCYIKYMRRVNDAMKRGEKLETLLPVQ